MTLGIKLSKITCLIGKIKLQISWHLLTPTRTCATVKVVCFYLFRTWYFCHKNEMKQMTVDIYLIVVYSKWKIDNKVLASD